MTRSGDIEFLDADGPAPLHDDEISGAQGLPRWVGVLGAAALLAIATGAVVASRGEHGRRPTVQPTTSAAVVPVPAGPAGPAVLGIPTGGSVRLPGPTAAVDIALAGGELYVLQLDRITVVNARTQTVDQSVATQGMNYQAGRDRLLVDAATQRLWVVRTKDGSSVWTFDMTSLELLSSTPVGPDIPRQAVLDGKLYVSTNEGIFVVDGSSATRIHTSDAAVVIAADPTRHRLLALDSGRPSALVALSPSGTVLAGAPIDIVAGNIAVVGSTIFLTGADAKAAVVRTLDPVTLRRASDVDIAVQLHPGANIAATGGTSIWLRSSGRNRDVLWCHDVKGGPLASWWTLPGTIASSTGVAFVLDDVGRVRSLNLFTGCSG